MGPGSSPPRPYQMGYSVGEVSMPALAAKDKTTVVSIVDRDVPVDPPVARSCLTYIVGCARPHWSLKDQYNKKSAFVHRVGREMPAQDAQLAREYAKFFKAFVRRHFQPLPMGQPFDFEVWLANTDYTESMKQTLRDARKDSLTEEDLRVKAFLKDEFVDSYKWPRNICGPTNELKAFLGPAIHAIDEVFYAYAAFVKHIPVAARPAYLREVLGDAAVDAEDYTSFESTVQGVHAELEYWLFEYMLGEQENKGALLWALRGAILGDTIALCRGVKARFRQRRKSGHHWTSSGNGMHNLIMNLFVCAWSLGPASTAELLERATRVKIVVEGDDSLKARLWPIDVGLFRRLGANVKLDEYDHYSQASFCGIVCDEDTLASLTDPLKAVATAGWATGAWVNAGDAKARALQRAKAMSMLYQYPACPVVSAFARKVLDLTKGYDVRNVPGDLWERGLLNRARAARPWLQKEKEITLGSRLRVQETFGLSVEAQLHMEAVFCAMATLAPIVGLSHYFPELWREVWSEFVTHEPGLRAAPTLSLPPEVT